MVKRLSDSEKKKLLEEWYGKGGKLEQSGFEDIESYRPHKHGKREPMLGKGARFVSLSALLADEESDIPAEAPILDVFGSNNYQKFQLLEGMALAGILRREDWEAVVALSLFSEGVSEREVTDIIGRSRGKTRDLLLAFKESVDSVEKILTMGGEGDNDHG